MSLTKGVNKCNGNAQKGGFYALSALLPGAGGTSAPELTAAAGKSASPTRSAGAASKTSGKSAAASGRQQE